MSPGAVPAAAPACSGLLRVGEGSKLKVRSDPVRFGNPSAGARSASYRFCYCHSGLRCVVDTGTAD